MIVRYALLKLFRCSLSTTLNKNKYRLVRSVVEDYFSHVLGDISPISFTDPNAPKKPANAFLMFCQQERLPVLAEHSRDNPGSADMTHQDLTKELAKKWNDLTDEQKKVKLLRFVIWAFTQYLSTFDKCGISIYKRIIFIVLFTSVLII